MSHRIRCLLLLTLLYTGAGNAASSVLIWPLNPSLPAGENASALWLENRGTAPLQLQIRTLGWDQQEYADQLSSQRSVIASPPVATLEPGARQLIRLMRVEPTPPGEQQSYRVLIDEMLPEEGSQAAAGVQFQMRYSVPLFAYGDGASLVDPNSRRQADAQALQPELTYSLGQDADGAFLYLHNNGPAHARLSQVQLSQNGKAVLQVDGLLGYVLPGRSMRWSLPAGLVSSAVTLEAKVNGANAASSIPPR